MDLLREDIESGLSLLPAIRKTDAARLQVYATNRQENPNRSPRQLIKKDGRLQPLGPAAGDYQFELTGGIRGLRNFKSAIVQGQLAEACKARKVPRNAEAIFDALQVDPVFAAALARLLYYTDPKPLPAVGDEAGAWALYLRTWRPGAYDRQPEELRAKWRKSYADAMKAYDLS